MCYLKLPYRLVLLLPHATSSLPCALPRCLISLITSSALLPCRLIAIVASSPLLLHHPCHLVTLSPHCLVALNIAMLLCYFVATLLPHLVGSRYLLNPPFVASLPCTLLLNHFATSLPLLVLPFPSLPLLVLPSSLFFCKDELRAWRSMLTNNHQKRLVFSLFLLCFFVFYSSFVFLLLYYVCI